MSIHLTENPYKGINAHYQSFLQSPEGGWTTFHNEHVTDLKRVVNRSLPPEYYALTEKSLQIQLSEENPFLTRSQSEQTMTPTLEVPMMPSEDYFVAVEIYHAPSHQ